MPSPRFPSSRVARRLGARRVLIVLLATVAVLLQAVHEFGLSRFEATAGPLPSPSVSLAMLERLTPATLAPRTFTPATPKVVASATNTLPEDPRPTLTVPPPPGVTPPAGAVLLYTKSPAAPAPSVLPAAAQPGAEGRRPEARPPVAGAQPGAGGVPGQAGRRPDARPPAAGAQPGAGDVPGQAGRRPEARPPVVGARPGAGGVPGQAGRRPDARPPVVGTQAASRPAPGAPTHLLPTDLLRGILILEAQGRLDLTPDQARRLAEAVRDLGRAYTDLRTSRDRLYLELTPEQRRWLESHPPRPGEAPSGAPELNAEGPARRALDALGPP